jgi:hypothetical protein
LLLAFLAAMGLAGCSKHNDFGPVANAAAVNEIRTALIAGGTEASGGEAASTGTGWATIRGQFVYNGDPPQMPAYGVTKEHNICTEGGKAPPQQMLVVDPDTKGIANIAVYLRDAKRVHDSAKSTGASKDFDQKVCVFLTHVTSITVGDTLNIKNSDPTGHNTNIAGTGFNRLIPEGQTVPLPIQKELAVPADVVCSIHPWMKAYLLPRKNGYHAVTDAQGKFEIVNVPAGEPIEFQVWHESGAAAGKGLVGTTEDASLKWTPRGRVTMTLNPDEVKDIKIVVQPNAFSL